MTVFAYAPDLMDRSKITAAAEVVVVRRLSDVDAAAGDTVVVDLSRPGVLDAVPEFVAAGARVIAFGSHVDREMLEAGRAAGAEVLARSAFFSRVGDYLGS